MMMLSQTFVQHSTTTTAALCATRLIIMTFCYWFIFFTAFSAAFGEEYYGFNELVYRCSAGTDLTVEELRKHLFIKTDDYPDGIGCVYACILEDWEQMKSDGKMLVPENWKSDKLGYFRPCVLHANSFNDRCDTALYFANNCLYSRHVAKEE